MFAGALASDGCAIGVKFAIVYTIGGDRGRHGGCEYETRRWTFRGSGGCGRRMILQFQNVILVI